MNISVLKLLNCIALVGVGAVLVYSAHASLQEKAEKDENVAPRKDAKKIKRVRRDASPVSPVTGGAVYTRWGRTECPEDNDTETVYSGVAGGQHVNQVGGGSNYLCLPLDPLWSNYNAVANNLGIIYGAEYQPPANNFPFTSRNSADLINHDVPCAVCRVGSRATNLMIPARNECYPGWHLEYHGYLMSGAHNNKARYEYVCVDADAESAESGYRNDDGALFYTVDGACGSLPCPPYVAGRELTCAVCTK